RMLIGSSVCLYFLEPGGARFLSGLKSLGMAGALSITSILGFQLLIGSSSYGMATMGQIMEKRASLPAAYALYRKSLAQRSNENISSYLQFRMAMLQRKMG